MKMPLPFTQLFDAQNNPYLAVNKTAFPRSKLGNATLARPNRCSFLHESLSVSHLASNRFSTDVTDRDDVILAILSLILLLIIEATLSSALLKTSYNQTISNFAFSVKHFVDLAREFRLHRLFRKKTSSDPPRHRINSKLLFTASIVLIFTFGLEVVVLYLTSPKLIPVTTATASLQLKTFVIPDWVSIRDSLNASSTSRPCTTVTLENVAQGDTQISACLTSNLSPELDNQFRPATQPVSVSIVSIVHEFGIEHQLTIGDKSAIFSARAYFSLQDEKTRLMRARIQLLNKKNQVKIVHHQLIAYLYNIYVMDTGDKEMNLERLNTIDFNFTDEPGPPIDIIQLNGKNERFRQAISVRYETNFTDIIPQGDPALLFAQQFFKGAIAMEIVGPDFYDLVLSTGNTVGKETIMWHEKCRTLNWLSLLIIMTLAFAGFMVLRYVLQPIGTAEIALVSVIGAADGNTSLAEGVRKNFGIALSSSGSERSDSTSSGDWHFDDSMKLSDLISSGGEESTSKLTGGTESIPKLPF